MAPVSLANFEPTSPDLSGLTFENCLRFLGEPFYLTILGRTLLVALSCTAGWMVLLADKGGSSTPRSCMPTSSASRSASFTPARRW
ncbi:hypothetical protein V5F41_13405 [Xanthobacter autotrophicus]|uniref:hypothetical protein n=1 Tax=Xanthobacter autotrophicus TaxID=280 RepID=UPI00372A9502